MRLDLHCEAVVHAGSPDQLAAREYARCDTGKAGGEEFEAIQNLAYRASAVAPGRVEIDPAAGIAQVPGAGTLENTARRLIELGGEAAQFCGEGELAARDLSEIAGAQHNALRHVRPVHQIDRDGGIVVAPAVEIVLGERIGRQRALHIEVRDGEPELALDRGRGEARRRLVGDGIEDEIAVEIGKAHYHAVAAIHPPAAA
jgi:hypothetical protein